MKSIKKILLAILVIALVVYSAIVISNQQKQSKMISAIENNELVIDQTIHEWHIDKEMPLNIELYVRNSSEYLINGNLVFLVTLSKKGLEEKFMKKMIDRFGQEELIVLIKKRLDEDKAMRFKALYNYILRGNKLKKGEEYEPVEFEDKNKSADYTFKFRQYVSIKPGEIIKINHNQQLPLAETGYVLSVDINTIEF